jgi:hypothetical protein
MKQSVGQFFCYFPFFERDILNFSGNFVIFLKSTHPIEETDFLKRHGKVRFQKARDTGIVRDTGAV